MSRSTSRQKRQSFPKSLSVNFLPEYLKFLRNFSSAASMPGAKRKLTFMSKASYKRPRVAQSTAAKASAALRLVRALNRQVELKSQTNTFTNVDFSDTVVVGDLLNLTQGDAFNERSGNNVNVVRIRGRIGFKASAGRQQATIGRFLIVQNKQQDADTAPAMGDGFVIPGVYGLEGTGQKNFKVLYDTTLLFPPMDSTSGQDATTIRSFDIKLPGSGIRVEYNGSAGTDIQSNGIYGMFVSDDPATPGSYPIRANGVTLCDYRDM